MNNSNTNTVTSHKETTTAAFTKEQVNMLHAAFEHIWAWVEFHDERMEEDRWQLRNLLHRLQKRGVVTHKQVEKIAMGYAMVCGKPELRMPGDFSEHQITRRIFQGEVSAFARELEERECECEQ